MRRWCNHKSPALGCDHSQSIPPSSLFFSSDTFTPFCHHPPWSRSPVCPLGNRYFPPLGGAQHSRCHATQLGSAPTCCGVHVLRKGRSDFDPPAQACPPPPSPHRVRKHLTLANTFHPAGNKNRIPYARSSNPVSSSRTCCHERKLAQARCHRAAAVQRRRHTHPDTRKGRPAN